MQLEARNKVLQDFAAGLGVEVPAAILEDKALSLGTAKARVMDLRAQALREARESREAVERARASKEARDAKAAKGRKE